MFKSSKKTRKDIKSSNGAVETLIGKGTKMSGFLQAEGTVRIEGEFEGDINTESDVVIGGEAKVQSVVKGENVTLAGRLEGSVEAAQLLEIRSSGTMLGDINVGNLVVEDGAHFSGNCQMFAPGEKKTTEAVESGKKQGNEKEGLQEEQEATAAVAQSETAGTPAGKEDSGDTGTSKDEKQKSNKESKKGAGKGKKK